MYWVIKKEGDVYTPKYMTTNRAPVKGDGSWLIVRGVETKFPKVVDQEGGLFVEEDQEAKSAADLAREEEILERDKVKKILPFLNSLNLESLSTAEKRKDAILKMGRILKLLTRKLGE